MIEATCGACGTVARIAETDVPAGAKFVNCASCKSRVPLPPGAVGTKPPPKPGAIPPAIPRTPPPIPTASTKPTVDLADLPAPKAKSALAGAGPSKPAAQSPFAGADLPAPKGAKPAAAPSALDLDDLMGADLPAPKGKADPSLDLPAPKARSSALGDAPASKPAPSALADLPAPKGKPSAPSDLPAPKAKQSALADLPAPKGKSPDLSDLPAPKGKSPDLSDLPAPKGKGGSFDDGLDLPMPASGFSDLPMPKPGANNDLPAPKGFFDDLPQPAKKSSQGSVDLPAPKGFFDDLPQPAMNNKPTVDLPAPKGFFDDLPQPAKASSQQPAGGNAGFFDDLPQPAKGGGKGAGPGGLFDDIGGAAAKGKHAHANDLSLSDMELGPGGEQPLSLDPGPSGGPELDLGLPLGEGADFTELDLSSPSGKDSVKALGAQPPEDEASPIKIKTPKGGKAATPIPISVKPKDDPKDLKLDLADDPHEGKPGAAAAAGKGAAKRKGPSPEEAAELRAAKRKRSRILLASVFGLAVVGGGGFFFYQKHAKEQERVEKIHSGLDEARKALAGANPNHWAKASTSAEEVLALEPNNVAALSISAEAAIAGALDNGANYEKRIAQGRTVGQKALGVGKGSDELERAKALMSIAAGQADRAIPVLQQLITAKPKSGWLQLYMGWAQLTKGDAAAAQAAFSQAVALDPATTLPALYGDGQARLLKADIEGARVAFTKVTQHKDGKDHIGAQVGLAATLPPQQSAQREAELIAILNRPNLDKADPRAVVKAWVLAGDVARQGGRLDIARERYRKAIAITPLELPALTGLANVELRDGKTQVARDLLTKALTAKPDDAEAQLLDGFADVVEGKLNDAASKFEKLDARQPPLPPLLLARLHVAKGRLLEAQGKSEEAIAQYSEGAKLAGDLDLTPTMAAVTTLTELAKKAPDEATAMGYNSRAEELLSKLAEKAKEDGEVALTLGVAYLEAGNATKAQEMLQRAVTLRDKDVESRLQLAKALSALKRTDEAIASLKEALAIDPKRTDVALELAVTYQNADRHNEAVAAYEKLLAEENVDVVVRVKAGRYFASRGAFDKAAAQAEPILKIEPQNAGGLYLKGEGLILAKKWDDARITLTRATDLDQTDAQALDALGRAFEGSLIASNDTKFIEGARHAYDRATKADPKMFHPHVGLGHALINQLHYEEAIKPLQAAINLNKTSSEVMYNMGLAYYGLRSKNAIYKKTAAEWFEDALRGQPELSLAERAETQFKLGDLYFDLNKPPQSAGAFDKATKLGEQMEKDLGVAPKWLTDTYFRLGQVYEGMNNGAAQKNAWERFMARSPDPTSSSAKEAKTWLGTSGKRFP